MSRIRAMALALALALPAAVGVHLGTVPAGAEVVVKRAGALEGFTLVASLTTPETFLLDLDGRVVHAWASDSLAGLSASLQPDGRLLRAARVSTPAPFAAAPGGQGGRVQLLAWDGKPVWTVDHASDTYLQHHDAVLTPKGNVLMLVWQVKTVAEAVAMGRDPATIGQGALWPDSVVEIDPRTQKVVWEWHVWDHLVQDRDPAKPNYAKPADQPGRIDVNYSPEGGGASWNHLNALSYDAKTDRILLSSRHFSEVWIIDHDTTTAQAKGPKGDLLFRWGNPAAYGHPDAERELFLQHDAHWNPAGVAKAGSILVFNNGDSDDRPYSTVDEIQPKVRNGRYVRTGGVHQVTRHQQLYPASGQRPDQFFAPYISGAQRLANGNLLVTDGPVGRLFEVGRTGQVLWEYRNDYYLPGPSVNAAGGIVVRPERLFRALRYEPDYEGLRGKKLVVGKPNPESY